ncbi:CvpA family protein [Penaeicola halotolerans]|uniref:CvpA family protein n=1 Tax=Penaeicola halotolerans TaxID=2793196 RepID=UPI001CF91847|nr:CvpA family protein [Penaeicola halotolerans]
MKLVDFFVLVVLAIGAYSGFRKGLLIEIISILALLLAIIGAFKLMDWLVALIMPHAASISYLVPVIAFLLLFIGIILIVRGVGVLLKKLLDLTFFGLFDNIFGALLGIIKWTFGVSLLLWVASAMNFEIPKEHTEEAVIYPYLESLAPNTVNLINEYLPVIQDTFDSLKALQDLL